MEQILLLSKKDLEFSKYEALKLYKPKEYAIFDNLLIFNSDKHHYKKLAYSSEAYEFLFKTTINDLEKDTKNFDWKKHIKDSFSVRIINSTSLERKVGGIIFDTLKNVKVDLKNPKTKIVFFKIENEIICGNLIYNQDKSFNKRKAHLRPELHPTSLSPQLAIASINLSGKINGKFLDPFCGSGGILLEAAILGFEVTGYDIDKIMINRSKINLDHYKIKNYTLKIHDATKINEKFDLIVTDLPYGKSSKLSKEIITLYKDFLKKIYEITDTAVILFPDFVDYESLLGKWNEEISFDYYLHKSLSKKIVLLKK